MNKYLFTLSLALASLAGAADNPIVQTCFTTDPAPMVDGDRLYVYTGHDENGADFFWMQEWRVYSTKDMANWTDHGSPLAIEDFSWGDDRAWAPQCVERDGKYYFYVPLHSKLSGGMAIGVAVGDSPTGPFKDALGKPLYDDGKWDNIDPSVMIDDDGQAWIFWGNPEIRYAKLNRDMISFDGEVKTVDQTTEGFGAPGMGQRPKDSKIGEGGDFIDCYTEGPWIMKRGKKYYLLYAAGGIPEHIAYSMADSPEGPWKYMGAVMPLQDTGSFTNHCGVADFKDKSYFFYHTGKLPGGGGFGRSVAVEEFKYNPDGTFPSIKATEQGVAPIATLNPYERVEGETMAFSKGVASEANAKTGVYVSDIHNGDWIKVANVDFGLSGPSKFRATVASALRGGTIEVRLDSIDSQPIGLLKVGGTGGWEEWQTLETALPKDVAGVHDLYFTFSGRKGPKLMNLDWWEFIE
ncbi:MAG: glycoside hydrolase family 43 protein [Muribaculaceae bacterium]